MNVEYHPVCKTISAFVIFGASLLIFDVLTWLMTQSQIIKFTSNAIQSAFRDTCTVNCVEESHAAIEQSRLPSRLNFSSGRYNSTAYWSTNCSKQFSRHNYKIWSASWNVFEVLRCIYLRSPWIDPSTATWRICQSVREMIEQVIIFEGREMSVALAGNLHKRLPVYTSVFWNNFLILRHDSRADSDFSLLMVRAPVDIAFLENLLRVLPSPFTERTSEEGH